jgi:hypothetical protein
MNLQNQPPLFVPVQCRHEIENLSKAALMDLVWDLATIATGACEPEAIMFTVRRHAKVVLRHRKNAKAAP